MTEQSNNSVNSTNSIGSDRRYIGSRETAAYTVFRSTKDFNIDKYQMRFILDVFKLDLDYYTAINLINGIWDVINDSFIGVMLDKTRTRWGKFRPYLLAVALPGALGTCLFWLAPMFFDQNPKSASKFVYFLALAFVRELLTTFKDIADGGLISTITPNPNDRVRVITTATVVAQLWESLPEVFMGLMIDLVNHNVIKIKMRSVYAIMGSGCAIIAGFASFYFLIITKERVPQSEAKHEVVASYKALIKNRFVMISIMSDFLSAFTVGGGSGIIDNYYIDVLGSASIFNIISLPGAVLTFPAFTIVTWARKRFSTRILWIIGENLGDMLTIFVFLIGSIGGRGRNGFYRKVGVMIPVLMAKDAIWKSSWGLRKVIPREVNNEILDYFEWKNGYRAEGVTITAKSMLAKLTRNIIGSFMASIMKRFGYDLSKGFGQQSDSTKYALFAVGTIIPVVTGSLAVIPKLFYKMSAAERERMYRELALSRAEKNINA
ncbi:MAG: MFS transporter [Oscillospiraceae bacterium]|nr:MFS transporter [Oscillospiraceae bacterium]